MATLHRGWSQWDNFNSFIVKLLLCLDNSPEFAIHWKVQSQSLRKVGWSNFSGQPAHTHNSSLISQRRNFPIFSLSTESQWGGEGGQSEGSVSKLISINNFQTNSGRDSDTETDNTISDGDLKDIWNFPGSCVVSRGSFQINHYYNNAPNLDRWRQWLYSNACNYFITLKWDEHRIYE